MKKMTLAAALLTATMLGGVANAKTLVYCSEGSPEGFDPALYTAGTTFDASSRPVYNRLVEFKPGTTEIEPGLAESWTVSDDGLQYTFKLRPGVKFQTTDYFKPTRDLNADDVVFSLMRQWKEDHPFHKTSGATFDFFRDLAHELARPTGPDTRVTSAPMAAASAASAKPIFPELRLPRKRTGSRSS